MTFSQNWQKTTLKIILFFILGWVFWFLWTFLLLQKDFLHTDSAIVSAQVQTGSTIWQVFNTPKIQRVYGLMQKNFYGFDAKTRDDIEKWFLTAMVNALGDKYTEYFDTKESEDFQMELTGNFHGIGAAISEHQLGAKIDRVIPDSPAEKSGLQLWDIITHANGESLAGKKASESVERIRGEKWTVVHLEYQRNEETHAVDVTRDAVHVPSVDGRMLEDSKIGYVQINSFGDKTPIEFYDKIRSLTASGAEWLILDFRFNGGGYLDAAQSMLSGFFPKNTAIVSIKENDPRKNEILYTVENRNNLQQIPIVVLVNEFSASASEIFAGAVQDHNRGLLVGKKTFGKGSVQEMFPLGDGTMVKITVAKWYTPKDQNIDEQGITPDITVDFLPEDYKNTFDRQLDIAKKSLQAVVDGKNTQEIIQEFNTH